MLFVSTAHNPLKMPGCMTAPPGREQRRLSTANRGAIIRECVPARRRSVMPEGLIQNSNDEAVLTRRKKGELCCDIINMGFMHL
jgi:hypothetical protein